MTAERETMEVLAAYPDDCRPKSIRALGSAGGFSGARFWRLDTPSGTLCLRRWPKEYPPPERLEFIQAVLWHVVREGFTLAPLPRETRNRKGYVVHADHLWELAPWMPGAADFREAPTIERLQAAMHSLAEFHLRAASFPLPAVSASGSPGIRERLDKLQKWMPGGFGALAKAFRPGLWPELDPSVDRILRLAPLVAGKVLSELREASHLGVSLQPCIRDVWHAHVLFEGNRVSGLIDFGSMQPDNVAGDVARLLGSMAVDDQEYWGVGLDAYRSVRPLWDDEVGLTNAFDRSTVLMSGLNWIDWIYRQGRVFDAQAAIPARLAEIADRLENLGRRDA